VPDWHLRFNATLCVIMEARVWTGCTVLPRDGLFAKPEIGIREARNQGKPGNFMPSAGLVICRTRRTVVRAVTRAEHVGNFLDHSADDNRGDTAELPIL